MNTTYVTVQRGEVDQDFYRQKEPHPLVRLHRNAGGDLQGVSIFGTDLQVTTETGSPSRRLGLTRSESRSPAR